MRGSNRKEAAACESLSELRGAIDSIDRDVVSLLGERSGYVMRAAEFKASAEEVAVAERVREVLQTRRSWAAEEGLSPEFVEALFQKIVEYFISTEMRHWKGLASAES